MILIDFIIIRFTKKASLEKSYTKMLQELVVGVTDQNYLQNKDWRMKSVIAVLPYDQIYLLRTTFYLLQCSQFGRSPKTALLFFYTMKEYARDRISVTGHRLH